MTGQETRNKLTDYWANHEIKEGEEYAIITNIIHQEWAELDVKAHKAMKGLQTQNLRDHLIAAELLRELPELRDFKVDMMNIFILHTSASLTINENADPTVRLDFESFFNHAVPDDAPYFASIR